MRKIMICLTVCVLAMSCGMSPEKRIMMREVSSRVKVAEFGEMKTVGMTFLKDEIKDSILYYRMKSSWDECFMNLYLDECPDKSKADFYKARLASDKAIMDSLENIIDDIPADRISVKTYRLNYLLVDNDGNARAEIFDAKFKNGRMIAYRLDSKSGWVRI